MTEVLTKGPGLTKTFLVESEFVYFTTSLGSITFYFLFTPFLDLRIYLQSKNLCGFKYIFNHLYSDHFLYNFEV